MHEDILEQLTDDYLQSEGYFTMRNVKYRPKDTDKGYNYKSDSVHSDIDILAINPKIRGNDKVIVVNCKSWQGGFKPDWELRNIKENRIVSGRSSDKRYRDLTLPIWANALKNKVYEISGSKKFTYYFSVTRIIGSAENFISNKSFTRVLGCKIQIITMNEMAFKVASKISGTPAVSQLGRTIQLLKSSGFLKIDNPKN